MKYSFFICREVTQSATIVVEADSIEDAHEKAIDHVINGDGSLIDGDWEDAEGESPEVYIPDESQFDTVT